jgi:hypothetical protein
MNLLSPKGRLSARGSDIKTPVQSPRSLWLHLGIRPTNHVSNSNEYTGVPTKQKTGRLAPPSTHTSHHYFEPARAASLCMAPQLGLCSLSFNPRCALQIRCQVRPKSSLN